MVTTRAHGYVKGVSQTTWTKATPAEKDRWVHDVHQALPLFRAFTVSVDAASVAATTIAEQDVTVTGITANDVLIAVQHPDLTAGMNIIDYRVKAADTVTLVYDNTTGGAIDESAADYTFVVMRL